MADSVRLTIDTRELDEFIQQAPGEVRKTVRSSIFAEAHEILADSQAIVPFDEGILSSSSKVYGPRTRGDVIQAEIGYGGAAKDYALIQHENLEYRHAEGREAKYLEKPAQAHAGSYGRRLVSELRAAFQRFQR